MRSFLGICLMLNACMLHAQSSYTYTNTLAPGLKEAFEFHDSSRVVRHGVYSLLYNDATLQNGVYENGKRNGTWQLKDHNNKPVYNGSYKDDLADGVWTYYNGGKKSAMISFKKGLKHGRSYYFEKGGTNYEITVYDRDKPDSSIILYPTGEYKEVIWYNFDKDLELGITLYPDGKLFKEILLKDGIPYTIRKALDENGKAIDIGTLRNGNGVYKEYNLNSKGVPGIDCEITFKNGEINGWFRAYFDNGQLQAIGKLLYDKPIQKWKFYDLEGNFVHEYDFGDNGANAPDNVTQLYLDKIYSGVAELGWTKPLRWKETPPSFPGGETQLLKYLGSAPYPAYAVENEISDRVFIKFSVDLQGRVFDVEVAKGDHEVLNHSSLEHVKKMPDWTPGLQNGIPVKVQMVVPFTYKMIEKKKKQ